MQLRSELPRATLAKAFLTPFDNAVATARTCYSSRVITDDDVRKNLDLRDKIASSTYKAGHHTTLQHAHFEFILEGVSRHALWSFFHAHPFYNSEQVSQRYVEVKAGRVLRAATGSAQLDARFDACVDRQMATYHRLNELLMPVVARLYFGIFKARKKDVVDKRWTQAIQKRCQEVSRYVLPVGTHAHLYHTISGLTLHRYHRIARSHDCPSEQAMIVDQMIAAVKAHDPDFVKFLEAPLPQNDTHDARLLQHTRRPGSAAAYVREFDAALNGHDSRLVSMTTDATAVLAQALRDTLGIAASDLDDTRAVALLLDPKENRALGEALNLQSLTKSARALELVTVTFKKKLSHTADSQAQRHRMTPGVRPVLFTHITPGVPDFITPVLFLEDDARAARAVYEREMRDTYDDIAALADGGVGPEVWQYLLPNAVPVRFTETGSLTDQHHKWTTRLCFNAQEEIWRTTKDEVEQVAAHSPLIGAWLLPPCGLRKRAEVHPFCPEGDRFCGQPVWNQTRSSYLRVL